MGAKSIRYLCSENNQSRERNGKQAIRPEDRLRMQPLPGHEDPPSASHPDQPGQKRLGGGFREVRVLRHPAYRGLCGRMQQLRAPLLRFCQRHDGLPQPRRGFPDEQRQHAARQGLAAGFPPRPPLPHDAEKPYPRLHLLLLPQGGSVAPLAAGNGDDKLLPRAYRSRAAPSDRYAHEYHPLAAHRTDARLLRTLL